jgi:hypothetical protein
LRDADAWVSERVCRRMRRAKAAGSGAERDRRAEARPRRAVDEVRAGAGGGTEKRPAESCRGLGAGARRSSTLRRWEEGETEGEGKAAWKGEGALEEREFRVRATRVTTPNAARCQPRERQTQLDAAPFN